MSANFSYELIPLKIRQAEYAVRGPIVQRANEMKNLLDEGKKFPFEKIIFCNIGNPMEFGQLPLTFHRQILAGLLTDPVGQFPADVQEMIHKIKAEVPQIGAYSHSQGHEIFRNLICDFLTKRDGQKALPENLFLTDGTSSAIKLTLQLLVSQETDAVLIPFPQYPLYNAAITLLNGTPLAYELDEQKDWGIDFENLEEKMKNLKSDLKVKAIVVINPGNPTGAVFDKKTLVNLVKFAERHGLAILADEVYQENIYDENWPFISLRKILFEINSKAELLTFHSASKGFYGECGLRGGFVYLDNVPCQKAKDQLYKLCNMCVPNTIGQATMAMVLTPPQMGDPSYELYEREKGDILNALKEKAKLATEILNSVDGVSCSVVRGSMYAFPALKFTENVIERAKREKLEPDALFCLEFLEETGIVILPGSGFKQKPGTFHIRVTILPPFDELKFVLESLVKCYGKFIDKI